MSQIAIWNLALGHLGDDATIGAPDELSRQAELCRQFWPTAVRVALQSHPWNFATRRITLSPLSFVSGRYAYTYAFPADAIALWAVGVAEQHAMLPKAGDFEIEALANGTQIILTDVPEAVGVFTILVTDTTRYSPMFTDALSWLLASYLAGPILKGDEGRKLAQGMLQQFRYSIGQAAVSDSNQRRTAETVREQHVPPWMAARGGGPREDVSPPYPRGWAAPSPVEIPVPTPVAPVPFDFAAYYNALPEN